MSLGQHKSFVMWRQAVRGVVVTTTWGTAGQGTTHTSLSGLPPPPARIRPPPPGLSGPSPPPPPRPTGGVRTKTCSAKPVTCQIQRGLAGRPEPARYRSLSTPRALEVKLTVAPSSQRLAGNPNPIPLKHCANSPPRDVAAGGGGGQRCVDSKNSQTTPATTSTSSIRQLLGAADAQTAHHATFSTAPTHQLLGSADAETTPARAPEAAANGK